MNVLRATFWLISALLLAAAFALVAVPILAFMALIVLLVPFAISIFGRNRRASPISKPGSPHPDPGREPLVIETDYRRLDPTPASEERIRSP